MYLWCSICRKSFPRNVICFTHVWWQEIIRKVHKDGILMLLFPGDLDLITLNVPSDSTGRWDNTNTRSQKDLVIVCFTSINCVWKPEPKVSKTNKHKDNFHTISVWLQFHDIFKNHLFWYFWHIRITPSPCFFMPSCLAWNIPEPKNARPYLEQNNVSLMSQTSDALWSWHIPLLLSSRTRTPPG